MIDPVNTGDDGDERSHRAPDVAVGFELTPTFEDLYTNEFAALVRLATLMCGRVEVARDIVQDSFVKLHVKWRGVDNPRAYLRRSVVNGCRSRARWERLRRGRPSRHEPTTEQHAEELNDVLLLLSPRQRAAIVLRFYEQRSEAEIAELLGCRPGTVGSLLSRGLTRMKHELTGPTTDPNEEHR